MQPFGHKEPLKLESGAWVDVGLHQLYIMYAGSKNLESFCEEARYSGDMMDLAVVFTEGKLKSCYFDKALSIPLGSGCEVRGTYRGADLEITLDALPGQKIGGKATLQAGSETEAQFLFRFVRDLGDGKKRNEAMLWELSRLTEEEAVELSQAYEGCRKTRP